jgi:cytochrome b involved in lipid metabolism
MAKKGRPKARLGRGFSLMDWMRLTTNAADLAGRKGAPLRKISMEEVRRHNSEFDAWSVLDDKVYNITPYLPYHPGTKRELMRAAGEDMTPLFNGNDTTTEF